MSFAPEITVAAIVERDRRFLLVEERIGGRLVFNQPAGHVEAGETVLEAVVRETLEETAWEFTPTALLGAYLWTHPVKGTTTLRFAFAGDVTRHHAGRALDCGIVGTHWLTREQMLGRTERLRSPLVLRCVDDYLSQRRLPLDSVASLDIEAARSVQAVAV